MAKTCTEGVLVGLLFTAGIYPLIGSLLPPADSDTGDTMMLSLYVALGVFLLIAVRNPSAHRSLIAITSRRWFTPSPREQAILQLEPGPGSPRRAVDRLVR